MKNLSDVSKTAVAVAAQTTSAALTATKVNGTGFKRARFVFNLGVPLTGASFNASIYNASTSGATFSLITGASLAQITEGAASCVAIVDTAINPSYPWLQVSGAAANSNYPASCIVELYQGVSRVLDTNPQQIVTV